MLHKLKIRFVGGLILSVLMFSQIFLLSSLGYASKKEVKLLVYPAKYTLTMSNTPGIQISVGELAQGEKVSYVAENGGLCTWGSPDYKIMENVSKIELSKNIPVYWLPCEANGEISEEKKNHVLITIFNQKGKQVIKKKLTILYDGLMYYNVKPADDILFKRIKEKKSK